MPFPFMFVLDDNGTVERCAADREGALALPSMRGLEAIQRYEGFKKLELVSYVTKTNVELYVCKY